MYFVPSLGTLSKLFYALLELTLPNKLNVARKCREECALGASLGITFMVHLTMLSSEHKQIVLHARQNWDLKTSILLEGRLINFNDVAKSCSKIIIIHIFLVVEK